MLSAWTHQGIGKSTERYPLCISSVLLSPLLHYKAFIRTLGSPPKPSISVRRWAGFGRGWEQLSLILLPSQHPTFWAIWRHGVFANYKCPQLCLFLFEVSRKVW